MKQAFQCFSLKQSLFKIKYAAMDLNCFKSMINDPPGNNHRLIPGVLPRL